MEDRMTSRVFTGELEMENGDKLSLWAVKTSSDTEGDSVSFTVHKKDGTSINLSNYNDRINQSWMYFCDSCWLGYRFRGFADKFLRDYSFTKDNDTYKKRFPELYTYIDMYRDYVNHRDDEGYRINEQEIFIRSAAMNTVRTNIVLGVPAPFNESESAHHAHGVDCDGNEKEFASVHTSIYRDNFDVSSDTYSEVRAMVEEYQEKGKGASFSFRELLLCAEDEQKKLNPEYKSLTFVLDRAGVTK